MKNFLFTRSLLFALLLISIQGYSQNGILNSNHSTKSEFNLDSPARYQPFISEIKQWRYVQQISLTGGSGGANYLVNQVYFKGDTLVDNIKYSKLYNKNVQPTSDRDYLAYMILEDTVDQKVFVYDSYIKQPVLLYDFKLNKGDEFNIYILSDLYSKHTVVKVDTIAIANKKLKRIEFNGPITWIEGIGCVTGSYIPSGGELICVRENDELLYLDANFNNCDTVFTQGTWDNIKSMLNNDIIVFPNPVVSTSVVRVQSSNHELLKIEIYSYSGELVKEDYFSGDYPIGSVQLAKGMYVYRITLGTKVIKMDKIIVIS